MFKLYSQNTDRAYQSKVPKIPSHLAHIYAGSMYVSSHFEDKITKHKSFIIINQKRGIISKNLKLSHISFVSFSSLAQTVKSVDNSGTVTNVDPVKLRKVPILVTKILYRSSWFIIFDLQG